MRDRVHAQSARHATKDWCGEKRSNKTLVNWIFSANSSSNAPAHSLRGSDSGTKIPVSAVISDEIVHGSARPRPSSLENSAHATEVLSRQQEGTIFSDRLAQRSTRTEMYDVQPIDWRYGRGSQAAGQSRAETSCCTPQYLRAQHEWSVRDAHLLAELHMCDCVQGHSEGANFPDAAFQEMVSHA